MNRRAFLMGAVAVPVASGMPSLAVQPTSLPLAGWESVDLSAAFASIIDAQNTARAAMENLIRVADANGIRWRD